MSLHRKWTLTKMSWMEMFQPNNNTKTEIFLSTLHRGEMNLQFLNAEEFYHCILHIVFLKLWQDFQQHSWLFGVPSLRSCHVYCKVGAGCVVSIQYDCSNRARFFSGFPLSTAIRHKSPRNRDEIISPRNYIWFSHENSFGTINENKADFFIIKK